MNENKYTIYKNLWGTMKTVLGGKFISLSVNIKKLESLHINTITTYLKALEKKEEMSYKRNRWQEIVKLRVAVNK